jgi:hypothetical protein
MGVTDFDTKVAVVVRDDLETWQRMNVTAFLVSGMFITPGPCDEFAPRRGSHPVTR